MRARLVPGLLVFAATVAAAGCYSTGGDDDHDGAGASAGLGGQSSGGSAGLGGSGGRPSGGSSSAGSANGGLGGSGGAPLTLPDPPDDSCAIFAPTYTETGDCSSTCALVMCSCASGPSRSLAVCHAERGCLTAVDCEALCAGEDTLELALGCTSSFQLCEQDADCGSGRCVTDAGATAGECTSGGENARCREDADCLLGGCVAIEADGTRGCSAGADGSSCNFDAECSSGFCAQGGVLTGTCYGGELGDFCYADDDCEAGLFCAANECSSGGLNETCEETSDCVIGACHQSTFEKRCGDGSVGATCDTADDCLSFPACVQISDDYGIRTACQSGEPGAACELDSDCSTMKCAPATSGAIAVCSDGMLGSQCRDSMQCLEGSCVDTMCQ